MALNAQILAIIINVIVSVIAVIEKILLKRFRKKGATAPESAIKLDRISRPELWRLAKLQKKYIICNVEPDLYYFDETAYANIRRTRRKRILPIVIIALLVIIGANFLNLF